MSHQSVAPQTAHVPMQAGEVVGGRFKLENRAFADAYGAVWNAIDTQTGQPLAVRVLGSDLFPYAEALSLLKDTCRAAGKLNHPNIIKTYGVGRTNAGYAFVAHDRIEGHRLGRVVQDHIKSGEPLSLRGAYNIIAHAANALGYAHENGVIHGAVRADAIWLTPNGQVMLCDFGVGQAILATAGIGRFPEAEQAALALEVKSGRAASPRSDVFGLGAVLYQMLTGLSPAQGFTPPSQAHKEATEAVDQILLRSLAGDPQARFESPGELQQALLPFVLKAPTIPPTAEFGMDIEIDISLSQPPPSLGPSPMAPPAVVVPKAAGLPQDLLAAPAPAAAPVAMAPEPTSGGHDLKAALDRIVANDAPRWMVVKDGLDHGPFSGRELVEQMLKGEVLEQHGLLNMDTGARKSAGDYDDFVDFLEEYKHKKRKADDRAALEKSVKGEAHANRLKLIIGVATISMLGLGVGGWWFADRQAADEETLADGSTDELYEGGEVEVSGDGMLKKRRRRGGGGGGGGGTGPFTSYEEAMNRAVSLGDATKGGGERRLASSQVASVMNRHINRFYQCKGQAAGYRGKVRIDVAIAGNGAVMGASVRQGPAAFQSCVASKVKSINFPSFPAPRMGAGFNFELE